MTFSLKKFSSNWRRIFALYIYIYIYNKYIINIYIIYIYIHIYNKQIPSDKASIQAQFRNIYIAIELNIYDETFLLTKNMNIEIWEIVG